MLRCVVVNDEVTAPIQRKYTILDELAELKLAFQPNQGFRCSIYATVKFQCDSPGLPEGSHTGRIKEEERTEEGKEMDGWSVGWLGVCCCFCRWKDGWMLVLMDGMDGRVNERTRISLELKTKSKNCFTRLLSIRDENGIYTVH